MDKYHNVVGNWFGFAYGSKLGVALSSHLFLLALFTLFALGIPCPGFARGKDAPPANTGIEVTDIAGRTVRVQAPVQRVILGEGRHLYLVAALDTDDPFWRIAGWNDDLKRFDPPTYAAYLQRFPQMADKPFVRGEGYGAVNLELVVSLQPDLVTFSLGSKKTLEDAKAIEKLAEAGIPSVFIDFREDPTRNTNASIALLGQLYGREERAQQLIAFRQQQYRRVAELLAAHSPVRPKVFVHRAAGYYDDCCDSFGNANFGEFVVLAGDENIASQFLTGTRGKINPEQVVVSEPAHIMLTGAHWGETSPDGRWIPLGWGSDEALAREKLAWFLSYPPYTGTEAVEEGNLYGIWHQFYNCPYEFVAVQQIAKWLHPQLFADLDPEQAFAELHSQFLPVPYRSGYMVSLK